MTSTYTVSPSSLHDLDENPKGHMPEYHRRVASEHTGPVYLPTTPNDTTLLSPFSSNVRSSSGTPAENTPAESLQYQSSTFSSDYSDLNGGDPFYGVDFGQVSTFSPHFLEQEYTEGPADQCGPDATYDTTSFTDQDEYAPVPSLGAVNPNLLKGQSSVSHKSNITGSQTQLQIATTNQIPVESRPKTVAQESTQSAPQLTPDMSGSGWSSDDCLPPTSSAMPRSPRISVSMWTKDGDEQVDSDDRHGVPGTESPRTVRAEQNSEYPFPETVEHHIDEAQAIARDTQGAWVRSSTTGQGGHAPGDRPQTEVTSINQLDSRRKLQAKNQEVSSWLTRSQSQTSLGDRDNSSGTSMPPLERQETDNIPTEEIPLGNQTVNRYVHDQLYYVENAAGPLREEDTRLMQEARNWGNAPVLHAISNTRVQPGTAQEAMQKYQKMVRDVEQISVLSRSATWGTSRRRASMPSEAEIEGITSGAFLKKLSISRDGRNRRPSILKSFQDLVRKPSNPSVLKRKNIREEVAAKDSENGERRDSQNSLAPPSRQGSWGLNKKPSTPSINTAFIGMATSAAAIGATHARSGSISNTPVTSPKSPFGFAAAALRRPRSRSELPRADANQHPSNLIDLLKKSGGPPVAKVAKPTPTFNQDDDDDEDDDGADEADAKVDVSRMDDITPNMAGFREHVLRLNPNLTHANEFLVDRIAHQMVMRYKTLLKQKIQHLNSVQQRNCPSGALCVDLGGGANPLDSKNDLRGIDPLSARPDSSDGDSSPVEGAINSDSFPTNIPVPPTNTLPAELECQLCFTAKKFQKPSDWTKHVHEDVQPFTCTWDRCREPKIFKRKADWVRHENEGHRHLEWWTCDVEDCRHTCYRRDNFLQHLVREHKFVEPKLKTKAAIKRSGGADPTWQKVEQCHVETSAKPAAEPCRFCGRTFPTWKKLTVHLAKHMEAISLPVLKLVASANPEPDDIISPVADLPPRTFGPSVPSGPTFLTTPVTPVKQEPSFSPQRGHMPAQANALNYSGNGPSMFQVPNLSTHQFQAPFLNQQPMPQSFDNLAHSQMTSPLVSQYAQAYNHQQGYPHPAITTTAPYTSSQNAMYNVPQHAEPFPEYNTNALGLHDAQGQQYSYNPMSSAPGNAGNIGHYTPQGSTSPYSHSSNPGQGPFYSQ